MDVKSPKGLLAPLHFFSYFATSWSFTKLEGSPLFTILSLRYGADFGRSRLVTIFGKSPCAEGGPICLQNAEKRCTSIEETGAFFSNLRLLILLGKTQYSLDITSKIRISYDSAISMIAQYFRTPPPPLLKLNLLVYNVKKYCILRQKYSYIACWLGQTVFTVYLFHLFSGKVDGSELLEKKLATVRVVLFLQTRRLKVQFKRNRS